MTRDEVRQAGRRVLLGDRVEQALEAVGIAQAVQAVSKTLGVDCGCQKRKAALNQWDERLFKPN